MRIGKRRPKSEKITRQYVHAHWGQYELEGAIGREQLEQLEDERLARVSTGDGSEGVGEGAAGSQGVEERPNDQ